MALTVFITSLLTMVGSGWLAITMWPQRPGVSLILAGIAGVAALIVAVMWHIKTTRIHRVKVGRVLPWGDNANHYEGE